MHNKKISFVNLYSKNNQALVSFYRDILGLKEKTDNPKNWHGFETGEVSFAIEPQSNRNNYGFVYNQNNPILMQFKAGNLLELESWTKDLEEKGVKMHQRMEKKSYGTISTLTDPDGNVIELLCN